MPSEKNIPRREDPHADGKSLSEDMPIPTASEDEVLEDTARLAREGREKLEKDPKERGTASTDIDTPRE